ncbi:MAG TPA: FKBP-type peptidyl-prolyl cis-trans isomerase [Solirubrobacterales bacterium]|nr:FKBP-type peptidyl-prolyl cis-trans isomerase [Solirubrobacterales bacterium]
MKFLLLICVLCLAFLVSGCGGDDETSSGSGDDGAGTTSAGQEKPKAPLQTPASKVVLGDYAAEGTFAAISGGDGDKKPRFEPSGKPASGETVYRELEVGSGPAAKHGDEVSIYYAGADHKTGKIEYYGWPPVPPGNFRLGYSAFGRTWEKTIEGMKAGGVREVIITAPYLSEDPLDYVIVLKALQPYAGA